MKLPLSIAVGPHEASCKTTPAEERHGPARRVLIADDNQDAAEALGMLLKMANHDVHLAGDGAAASSWPAGHPIAVLDIGCRGYRVRGGRADPRRGLGSRDDLDCSDRLGPEVRQGEGANGWIRSSPDRTRWTRLSSNPCLPLRVPRGPCSLHLQRWDRKYKNSKHPNLSVCRLMDSVPRFLCVESKDRT